MKTRCNCVLNDCAYYNAVPASARECDCAHPEKGYYMYNTTCPLYRKNWGATQDKLEELKKKIMPKKRL